jgi:chromosome segregation ATPase
MINNLLKLRTESRKSSERIIVDASENKDQIMNNLTNEVFTEYKKKLQNLRKDNQNLLNELEATNRNFDVINKKYNESQNLIKRLNEELLKLKSRPTSEESENNINYEDKIKSYTKKIDELYSQNEYLKHQLNEYKNKYNKIDSELKKKKNETNQTNELNNQKYDEIKIEKEKLAKENLFLQTKLKTFMNETNNSKKEIANLSKAIIELDNMKQKLLNENKILENNLEQARNKLIYEINIKEDLIKKFKEKGNEDKIMKEKYEEIKKKYEEIQEELSLEKSNNAFNEMNNKNLLQEINQLKNPKKWNSSNKIKSYVSVVLIKSKTQPKNKINKFNSSKLKEVKGEIKLKLTASSEHKKNKIKKFDTSLFDLMGEIELKIIPTPKKVEIEHNFNSKNKIESLTSTVIITRDMSKIIQLKENIKNMIVNQINIFVQNNNDNFTQISKKIENLDKKLNKSNETLVKFKQNIFDYLCIKFNSLKNENNLLQEKNNQCTKEVELFKRKYDYDIKKLKDEMEKKLEKKRNKKHILKKQIEELKNTIIDMEKKKIDLSEIKKLFELVSNISQRLNLTFDNLQMAFKCKICNEVKDKMLCLPSCGHSVCTQCLYKDENSGEKQISRCFECGNNVDDTNIPYNYSLNGFIARYKYAKQQVESDLEMMVKSIQAYISQ